MGKLFPKRWHMYERVGKQIDRTRFIAFKVPLAENINQSNVAAENQLYPSLLLKLIPTLGIVIDLTDTTKYYSPSEFQNVGVAYKKIRVRGEQIPSDDCWYRFRDAVEKFLSDNAHNDKLIGVHCTHGLNRTGYLVCRYMIEQMKMSQSIESFEAARGHKIERFNYRQQLKSFDEILPSQAVDSDRDKGTQTQPGFWIDGASIRFDSQHKQTKTISHFSEEEKQMRKLAPLSGYVSVKRSDLIPDGQGGFFIHIQAHDIKSTSKEYGRLRNPTRRRNDNPSQSCDTEVLSWRRR